MVPQSEHTVRAAAFPETEQHFCSLNNFTDCQGKIRLQRATMKIYFISLLLLLACLYPSLAQGSFENCCLKYTKEPKMSIKRKIVRFRIQESDGGCNRPAVIFTVVKKKLSMTFCADPTKSWVMKMVKSLETKVENN